jgi:hypothetical protein
VIRTPRQRFFEVACVTDPRLLHTGWADKRTPANFYSSRSNGILVNDRGDAAWTMPPQALRRFAGARRLYYALATYGSRNGEDPRFTIAPDALARVPFVAIAPDFTGRSLDRRRLGLDARATAAYGARTGAPLRWGGDAVLEAEQRASRYASNAGPGPSGYDDGHDPGLWRGLSADESDPDYADDHEVPLAESAAAEELEDGAEAYGFVNPPPCHRCGTGRLDERAQARSSTAAAFGSTDAAIGAEEVEDGAEWHRRNPEGLALPHGQSATDASPTDELEDGYAYHQRHGDTAEYGAPVRRSAEPRPSAAAGQLVYGRRAAPIRHHEYRDDDREESLAVGPATRALGVRPLDASPLDVAEKVRLLRLVARVDSGDEGYGAAIADPPRDGGGWGLLWGIVLFPQRSGALGRVLARAKARETRLAKAGTLPVDQTMIALFGDQVDRLLQTVDPALTPDPEARLAAVGGAPLWEEPWIQRFRAAGRIGYVQAAQNEEAVVEIVDKILPIARDLGLLTPRQLALLIDRAVHMGVGGARSWIMRVVGPIHTEADRAAALAALGLDDLRALQQRSGLEPDGRWGPLTHAAMTRALRGLGAAAPLRLLAPERMVDALLEAARAEGFGERMRAIADERTELDDAVSYDVT